MSVKRLRDYLKGEELDPNTVHWRPEPAMGQSVGHIISTICIIIHYVVINMMILSSEASNASIC